MRLVRFGHDFSDGELWEGLELGNNPNKDSRIINEELHTISTVKKSNLKIVS